MTDAIDLTKEQRNTLSILLRRFLPGVAVWAYGSRVKWTARPNSDLDLVAFPTPAQRPQVAELKETLAESNLPFPVDLHVWDDVPERFREIIRKEYVVVQEAKEPESGSGIADGWNGCTIGELCDAGVVELQTGPFGTQLHAHDYVEDGVPVVPTEAIRNRQIDHSVLPKISPGKAEELARHRLELGDILFARRGVQATGHIGCVREAEEGFLCGTGAIRLRVRKGGSSVNPDFLSHVLANPASVEWFKFHAIGATMPNLNEGIIRSFPLQIPTLPEQRAIAHILGTLDDKIELNRRMNETLEAMARALFKSWFVDFDPVRAKAEGRNTGLPKPLADLFPDSFGYSELGEIPRGWEVGSIYTAAEVIYGAPFSSAKFNSDGIGKPLIRIRDLVDESPGVFTAEEHPKGYLVKPGDIVVGMDGEFRSYLWGGVESWLNQRVCVFKPKTGFSSPFVLHSIIGLLAGVEATETATTVIHLGKNDIDRFKIVVPAEPILTAFGQLANPLFQRIVVNKQESRTLTALRDTLLPKLISGELRVKDSDHMIETV